MWGGGEYVDCPEVLLASTGWEGVGRHKERGIEMAYTLTHARVLTSRVSRTRKHIGCCRQKRISVEEREYIENSIAAVQSRSETVPTPWASIFKSIPVWAIVVNHTTQVQLALAHCAVVSVCVCV